VLLMYVGGEAKAWELISAGAIWVVIPVLILTIMIQRYITSALTWGAVKG